MVFSIHFKNCNLSSCRFQWLRGLRRRSAAARLLRLWVRIPPGAWTFVCCECCVMSGRGLCDGLITRPEGSYRLWCVVVYDLETSRMRRPWSNGGSCAERKQSKLIRRLGNAVELVSCIVDRLLSGASQSVLTNAATSKMCCCSILWTGTLPVPTALIETTWHLVLYIALMPALYPHVSLWLMLPVGVSTFSVTIRFYWGTQISCLTFTGPCILISFL